MMKDPASPQLRRAIPASGEEIPVIGLGTYQAFDVGPRASDRAALKAVLQGFVHAGSSVVDSSPMYGRAEEVVGAIALELALRGALFLATKVWTSGRAAGVQQMEQSFRLLGSSTIDLMQIHNLVDWKTHTVTLKQWKEQGRVRYIGITLPRRRVRPAGAVDQDAGVRFRPAELQHRGARGGARRAAAGTADRGRCYRQSPSRKGRPVLARARQAAAAVGKRARL